METTSSKVSIVKNFYVIVAILVLGGILGIVALVLPATQRGFYCNDDYITKPYIAKQTVSTFLCLALSVVMAFAAVLTVDLHNLYTYTRGYIHSGSVTQRYLLVTIQCVLFMGCGALVEQTILLLTKKTVGELRPHFISVCYPDRNEYGELCEKETYSTNYIMTTCPSGDPSLVAEARLSFPSGHSSFIFYGAVTGIIYIKSQLITTAGFFKMFFVSVQFSYFIFAWWVALTRIRDYWHHPWDVLTGATIGTTIAILIWKLSPMKYKRRELLRTGTKCEGEGEEKPTLHMSNSPSVLSSKGCA